MVEIYALSPLSITHLHASVFLCFSNEILQSATLIRFQPSSPASTLTDGSFGFVKEFRRIEGVMLVESLTSDWREVLLHTPICVTPPTLTISVRKPRNCDNELTTQTHTRTHARTHADTHTQLPIQFLWLRTTHELCSATDHV
jgi:hypothetical protein